MECSVNTNLGMDKGETSEDRSVVYCIQRVGHGKRKGDPFVLKGREVVVGRHPKANIFVDSEDVSRKHAVLTRSGTTWCVLDHKSLGGVWVNKKQLAPLVPCNLSPGDVFTLGSPKTAAYMYMFFQSEEQKSDVHFMPSTGATASEDSQNLEETRERVLQLSDRLESMLQEKKDVLRELKQQQQKFKVSQKQEKKLDHLAKSLKVQLKRQKKEERKLQKQLQTRQKEYDRSVKQEKKLQNQLKKRKKCEEELQKKLHTQKKKFQESLKQQKSLQKELKRKGVVRRKRKQQPQPQESQKEDPAAPSTSKGHSEEANQQSILTPPEAAAAEAQVEGNQDFEDVLQTQLNCSICSELFFQAHTLGCSHTFCKYCISMWRQKKDECPICRTPVRSIARSLVVDNIVDQVVANLSPQFREHRLEMTKERDQLHFSTYIDDSSYFRYPDFSVYSQFSYSGESDSSISEITISSDDSDISDEDSSSGESMEGNSSCSDDDSSDSVESTNSDSSSLMGDSSSSD